jgi:hypothetical protein
MANGLWLKLRWGDKRASLSRGCALGHSLLKRQRLRSASPSLTECSPADARNPFVAKPRREHPNKPARQRPNSAHLLIPAPTLFPITITVARSRSQSRWSVSSMPTASSTTRVLRSAMAETRAIIPRHPIIFSCPSPNSSGTWRPSLPREPTKPCIRPIFRLCRHLPRWAGSRGLRPNGPGIIIGIQGKPQIDFASEARGGYNFKPRRRSGLCGRLQRGQY